MKTWIILLRGINIGGRNIIPMADLREQLRKAGYLNVRTYIQSGNIVLSSKEVSAAAMESAVTTLISTHFGITPKVMAISQEMLKRILDNNPFPDAAAQPKTLHVFFLGEAAKTPNLEKITNVQTDTERFHLTDNAAYLHLPDGVWKSKLARRLETLLGVPTTARNWRSVSKILELSQKKPKL